jgi:hypothetical protein
MAGFDPAMTTKTQIPGSTRGQIGGAEIDANMISSSGASSAFGG